MLLGVQFKASKCVNVENYKNIRYVHMFTAFKLPHLSTMFAMYTILTRSQSVRNVHVIIEEKMGWMPDSVLAFGLVIAGFPVRFLR